MTQMVLVYFFFGGGILLEKQNKVDYIYHIHLIMLVQGFLTAIQRLKINETV